MALSAPAELVAKACIDASRSCCMKIQDAVSGQDPDSLQFVIQLALEFTGPASTGQPATAES